MPRSLPIALAALLLAAGITGCATSGRDIAGDVCKKADACGSLSGISAAGCRDVINKSVASMAGMARADAENAYSACLGMTDCAPFAACVDGVMRGSTTGSGGSGSGGSPAGGSGGSGSGSGGSSVGGGDASAGSMGSGGSGAGGAGTGGSPATTEVMTSSQNAYWMPGSVTKVTSGTADVNADENTTYQRWQGFGGCFNEMGWDALSVVSADQVTMAIKLLFDAQDGANFVYGRLPMGASDFAMSWYTLDDTTAPD